MVQGERASPDELEERYAIVREKIGMGLEQRHFVKWAVEHTDWNVSERQLRKYFKAVLESMQAEITEGLGMSPALEYARHCERLDFLYRDAVDKGDNKTALLIAKEYADFRDLKNPEKQIDWRTVANEMGLTTDAEKIYDRLERLALEEQHEQSTNG